GFLNFQFFLYRLYFLPILILLAVRRGFAYNKIELPLQRPLMRYGFSAQLKLSPFPSIVWRNGSFIFLWNKKNSSILFLFCNIILNQTDMYISKRFSSEVKSTKVTQKMDKIVSVTNKNIYRESLLTSSKLENFIKIKYFVFLFNEYQADGLNYTRNPGFKEKRYGLDCIETQRKRIGAETQWKLIIVNLFQSNIEESPILHCDKNSMNLMLFIK
ncbi:hypothetical protein ACJX0J_000856, partial [Zea mays]